MNQSSREVTNYILIDGSYYCFYRYYALVRWFSKAYPDVVLDDPAQNPVFVEKYKKMFVEKLKEIPKKLKLTTNKNSNQKTIMVLARDCHRANNWRNSVLSADKITLIGETYKVGRNCDEEAFMGGPFFKMAYDTLFNEAGIEYILHHQNLEADDCIALFTNSLTNTWDINIPSAVNVFIISADKDFLQLVRSPEVRTNTLDSKSEMASHLSLNVQVFDLKFKSLSMQKSSRGNADIDLFVKIVCGDKSDNILPVMKGCGPKTALKYYHNRKLFEEKLEKDPAAKLRYEVNKTIIDFKCIPQHLQDEFLNKN